MIVHLFMSDNIYIYIYIERERESIKKGSSWQITKHIFETKPLLKGIIHFG